MREKRFDSAPSTENKMLKISRSNTPGVVFLRNSIYGWIRKLVLWGGHKMIQLSSPLSPRLAAVAKRICELGDWSVSNLRLQKLMYICQMIHLGRTNGEPLIDENFEAWMYGPVVPKLYHKMKIYGSKPVGDRFINAGPLSAEQEKVIADVCSALKQFTDAKLVSITHRDGGGWSKNYDTGERGVVIPTRDILDEYRTNSAAPH